MKYETLALLGQTYAGLRYIFRLPAGCRLPSGKHLGIVTYYQT
jgi:hypothetical protein